MTTGLTTPEPDPMGEAVREFTDPNYVPLHETLGGIRTDMQFWNEVIVHALSERGKLVKDATRFKLDISQVCAVEQLNAVFGSVAELASAEDCPLQDFPDQVAQVFRVIVATSIYRQYLELENTKLIDPPASP